MDSNSKFLIVVLAIILLPSCNGKKNNSGNSNGATQPNIVLIMADDQGWGDLSFNGNRNLNTPHIDAIAQNGVSFQNFYVQPVCSPTRAELLTGRYFPRLGVYATSAGGERMNLGETTIAEIFKNAGYQTAAYGKWHNGMQPPYHPNARGFDDFYGFCSGHWGNYFSPMLENNGKIVKGEGFLVDDLTDKGLEFIASNTDKPFFLYLPLNTPHSPMQVPDAYWNRLKDRELALKYQDSTLENTNFTKAALAMVENIDHNVGRITKKLKALGLEENTIVVYLSDNGPNGWRWNNGMRGKKGSTDEGGVRSPFFVQWKDSLPQGKTVPQIASAIDILPTLASLAGIDIQTQKPLDGKDLKPLLFEENSDWEDRVVYNHWSGATSIRTQKYRLDNEDRLYDMENDMGQTEDIAEKLPKLADSLMRLKKIWSHEVIEPTRDSRPLTLGHPNFEYTQLPARDGIAHGNVKRSNKYPNDSFFLNWTSVSDSITWDVEVWEDGKFEVELYYTCAKENIGSSFQLRFLDSRLNGKVAEAHDPPLTGMENDRNPRIESYIKDFKPMKLGTMSLKKGRGALTLKATEITGQEVMDFRLLVFKRL